MFCGKPVAMILSTENGFQPRYSSKEFLHHKSPGTIKEYGKGDIQEDMARPARTSSSFYQALSGLNGEGVINTIDGQSKSV